MAAYEVPYVKLNAEQEAFCLDKLALCNPLIKKWSLHFGNKQQLKFRKNLFNSVTDKTLMPKLEQQIPVESLDEFRADCATILEVHNKPEPLLDDKTVEWAMVCGFSALATRHAKKNFMKNRELVTVSFGDYLNEAYIGLIDSIYGYSNRSIMFSTYCWSAMKNRMNKTTNFQNPFCPLTNPHIKLIQQFEETKGTFNDHVTFDEVTEAMGVKPKEAKILAAIMVRVHSESQMLRTESGNDDVGNDYSQFSIKAQKQEFAQNAIKTTVQTAIENANLTEFELKVLNAFMTQPWGWQTELAKNEINPSTGKNYTKTWIGTVLDKAQEKVKLALKRAA